MYQICKRCVMDTTDPDIVFDERGYCNHCKTAINKQKEVVNRNDLIQIISEIHTAGVDKKYDCVVGISGGVDSSYLLWLVNLFELRPFVVHLDNGYNTELSVRNMNRLTKKLGLELHTYHVDTPEFKDLQLSFLKASVPDLEIPTDHALVSMLNKIARKENIRYVVSGHNTMTESIAVPKWSHGHYDWRYIKMIQRRFGTTELKDYAHTTFFDIIYEQVLNKVKTVRLLNYLNCYNKNNVIGFLEREFGWETYRTKHAESTYTFFVQAFVLPVKFGFDKRRMHLSNLICSGQMTRDEALAELKKPLYTDKEIKDMMKMVCEHLNISEDELVSYLEKPNKCYYDYPSYDSHPFYRLMKHVYKKATGL